MDVTITARDGGSFSAYLAQPDAGGPFPGIVLIQEIFGVNDVMRQTARDWADIGYVVLCPDLFWRQRPGVRLTDRSQEEWDEANALMKGMDQDKAIEDIRATIDHLRDMAACTGRVGALGFCLGGRLAYLTAARTDVDCAVGYYGVGLEKLLDETPSQPLLLHIAEKDHLSTPEAQSHVKAALADLPDVEIRFYPGADHAFARPGGAHYDARAAELAKKRTAEFLGRHLKKIETRFEER